MNSYQSNDEYSSDTPLVEAETNAVGKKQQQQQQQQHQQQHQQQQQQLQLAAVTFRHTLITDFLIVRYMLTKHYILSSLLLLSPFGLLAAALEYNTTVVFSLNFLSLVPLAWLLEESTEHLTPYCSATVAALINVSLGNAEELIIALVAMRRGLLGLVKATLLGSLLSNLMLVLGCSLLAAGVARDTTTYDADAVQQLMMLMMFGVMAVALPTAFEHTFYTGATTDSSNSNLSNSSSNSARILLLSRMIAVIVLLSYVAYIYYLFVHNELRFEDDSDSDSDSDSDNDQEEQQRNNSSSSSGIVKGSEQQIIESVEATALPPQYSHEMSLGGSLLLLSFVTLLVCVQSDALVDSVEGVSHTWQLPSAFIGIVLLPIVGNAAEHAAAVSFAYKNKMSVSISIAVGSAAQILLLLMPLMTLFAWLYQLPLLLHFGAFDTTVLVAAVAVVSQTLKNGQSNWLQGALLIAAYAIIALAFYLQPQP